MIKFELLKQFRAENAQKKAMVLNKAVKLMEETINTHLEKMGPYIYEGDKYISFLLYKEYRTIDHWNQDVIIKVYLGQNREDLFQSYRPIKVEGLKMEVFRDYVLIFLEEGHIGIPAEDVVSEIQGFGDVVEF